MVYIQYGAEREEQRYETYTARCRRRPDAIVDKNGAVTCGGERGGRGEERRLGSCVLFFRVRFIFTHSQS